ncbi:MAG TPA: YncE family protein [Micromonosporaceae bacterium]
MTRELPRRTLRSLVVLAVVAGSGCASSAAPKSAPSDAGPARGAASAPAARPAMELLAGMPPYPSRQNVYAAAGPGMLSPKVRDHLPLVYVPNTNSDDVYVINPATFKVVDRFYGGPEPQHVVPSYDMSTLYVTSSRVPGGSVLPINPHTGRPGKIIKVQDVYNLYFTPDGKYAIVVAEYYRRLDFYDPRTWQRKKSAKFPGCAGINHMDFTVDGKTALVSCEFANRMIAVDVATGRMLRELKLDVVPDGMPQDTRLVPDGTAFLVADMHANGVYVFDGAATRRIGFIRTGVRAHGIYFSRDGRRAFVSNRDEGSVSVLDMATRKPAAKWRIPGGGSPDMGGVSADGKVLWLTGRYDNEVYAFRISDGFLLARIKVGSGPHGLTVWPQPGRYSLGHTGNIR